MQKVFLGVAFIALLNFSGPAQTTKSAKETRPSFAGTWDAENKKSDPSRNVVLTIEQVGDQITMADSREYNGVPLRNKIVLYADRRGERNLFRFPWEDSETDVRSATFWKAGKLVRKSKFSSPYKLSGPPRQISVTETQTFSISDDGNSLVLETETQRLFPVDSIFSPINSHTKRVFRRRK